MAAFCGSLMSCFPGILFRYIPNDFETVPVASVISGTTLGFILLLLLLLILLLTDVITVIHLVESSLFAVQKLRTKAYIRAGERKKIADTRDIKTVFFWKIRTLRMR